MRATYWPLVAGARHSGQMMPGHLTFLTLVASPAVAVMCPLSRAPGELLQTYYKNANLRA